MSDPACLEAEAIRRAQQTERRRIAQLLHDTVAQSLTGTYLQAMVIAQKLRKSGGGGAEEITCLVDKLHQAILEMRTVTNQLSAEEAQPSDPAIKPSENG